MKALRFTGGRLRLEEVTPPTPAHDEALVKVLLAGVCSTDLEITRGYMDFRGTLGHEFVGTVAECEGAPELVGARVVGEINAACGGCDWCRREMPRHCPERTVLGIAGRDGAFAEYLTLPVWNLHRVPEPVPDRAAVFTEPLAAAFEILSQVHIPPERPVLLIGDGRLGQLIVRVLAAAGLSVDAVGRRESKLMRMKGFIGRAFIGGVPPDTKYPVVIEASGSAGGWSTAIGAVEPRGTVVLKSTFQGGFDFNPAPLVINEVTVVGSRCGPFPPALRALEQGLDPTPLVDGEFPLEDWEAAFRAAREKETVKILFKVGED